jgi:SAM-dependent methyltransferase
MPAMPCLGCGAGAVEVLVDLGPQPPSNRFERPQEHAAETHPLVVGQCGGCGLIQLLRPMPAQMARSRFEWLTYNEPEGHLDDLVARLRELPGIGTSSRIVGLTYKDDTTLARFNRLGYSNTYRYDMAADFDLRDPCAGLESIQAAIDERRAGALAAKHGSADLLVVRHILEHAHHPQAFVRALRALVKPGGYLVLEMPDCTKFIGACDYSFLWEEHITYFSETTLRAFLQAAGVALQAIHLYPYPLEDSLIAVVRNAAPAVQKPAADAVPAALAAGRAFARRYTEGGEQLRGLFRRWQKEGKRVAVFGAGHLAAKFVNFFGLGPLIDCVVDDNARKQELLMPGSRLPIRSSATLTARPIDLCLLSLNPESEQKVLAKNQAFLERGGRFLSIFAASSRAVQKAAP